MKIKELDFVINNELKPETAFIENFVRGITTLLLEENKEQTNEKFGLIRTEEGENNLKKYLIKTVKNTNKIIYVRPLDDDMTRLVKTLVDKDSTDDKSKAYDRLSVAFADFDKMADDKSDDVVFIEKVDIDGQDVITFSSDKNDYIVVKKDEGKKYYFLPLTEGRHVFIELSDGIDPTYFNPDGIIF